MNMFILTYAPFNKTLMYVRFDLWYKLSVDLKSILCFCHWYCDTDCKTADIWNLYLVVVSLSGWLVTPFCILWLSHWVGDWLRPLTSNHKPNAVDVSSVCFLICPVSHSHPPTETSLVVAIQMNITECDETISTSNPTQLSEWRLNFISS